MAQSSGPISQGTATERQFTDALWRDKFGDESGVIGDMDGSSYKITLPVDGDIASVGSASQASLATVAGFVHRISENTPEPITIPAASSGSRTDVISLRYDPSYAGLPGPVRLFRIAGSSSAIPNYDDSPPGVEDLPLWAITRVAGQSLSQATVTRLVPRLAPSLEIGTGVALPINVPLGTEIRQGKVKYRRELVSGSPAWVLDTNNGGTTGAIIGPIPPAGSELIIKTIKQQGVTNQSGDTTITYPGGAFPNGVCAVTANTATAEPFAWTITPYAQSPSVVSMRAYNLITGDPAANLSIAVSIIAIGW